MVLDPLSKMGAILQAPDFRLLLTKAAKAAEHEAHARTQYD